jgi:hypothetical protein
MTERQDRMLKVMPDLDMAANSARVAYHVDSFSDTVGEMHEQDMMRLLRSVVMDLGYKMVKIGAEADAMLAERERGE